MEWAKISENAYSKIRTEHISVEQRYKKIFFLAWFESESVKIALSGVSKLLNFFVYFKPYIKFTHVPRAA